MRAVRFSTRAWWPFLSEMVRISLLDLVGLGRGACKHVVWLSGRRACGALCEGPNIVQLIAYKWCATCILGTVCGGASPGASCARSECHPTAYWQWRRRASKYRQPKRDAATQPRKRQLLRAVLRAVCGGSRRSTTHFAGLQKCVVPT